MKNQSEFGVKDNLTKAIRLLTLVALRGLKQKEQIDVLDRAGYTPKEIAELLVSTSNAISVRLNEVRNERKSRKGGKKHAPNDTG